VGRRVHTYSFVMSVRSSVKGVTQRAAALLSLVWWRSDAALQRITRSMSTDFFLRCKESADPAACSRLRESALVLVRENSGTRGRERWVPRPKGPREPQRRAFAKWGSEVARRVEGLQRDDPHPRQRHGERVHVVLEVHQLHAALGQVAELSVDELSEAQHPQAPLTVDEVLQLGQEVAAVAGQQPLTGPVGQGI